MLNVVVYMVNNPAKVDTGLKLQYMRSMFYWGWSTNLICMQLFLIFNLILNYDMYRMMKNPFKPPRIRVNNYYIKAGIAVLFILSMELFFYFFRYVLYQKWIQYEPLNDGFDWLRSLELDLTYLLYPSILTGNFIIILKIIHQLSRKGMSPRLMRNILQRYILVFIVTLPFFIISFIYYLSR